MKFVALFARRLAHSPANALAPGNCRAAFSRSATRAAASSLTVRDVLNQKMAKMIISDRNYSMRRKKRRWARSTTSKDEDDEDDDEEEEQEEEEEEEDDGMPRDYRTKEFVLLSRRLDAVLGRTLNASLSAVGNAIQQGQVRVNETVITRKAQEIDRGDEVHVWERSYEDNVRLATVHRVCIVRCRFDVHEGYMVKVKHWHEFITDNWVGEEEEKGEEEGSREEQQQKEKREEEGSQEEQQQQEKGEADGKR